MRECCGEPGWNEDARVALVVLQAVMHRGSPDLAVAGGRGGVTGPSS